MQLWTIPMALTCALAIVLLNGCHKEPPSETVRRGGSAGASAISGGASGAIGASGSAAEGASGNSGSNGASGAGGTGTSGVGAGAGAGSGSSAGDGSSGASAGDGAAATGGDPSGDPDSGIVLPTPAFTKRGLLEAAGACALQQYEDFLAQAQQLQSAAAAYAEDQSDEALAAVRSAWREANASWQRAEAFGFGPASADSATGGQSLRDLIYAFPYANRCGMDANLLSEAYAGSAFEELNINVRGLGAIEYLLFRGNTGNACAAGSTLNTSGDWAALSSDTITGRRAAYAARAAADVRARAQALIDAWHASRGNFTATLATAGEGSSVFASQQDAFNAINEALYYIEIEAKDLKLGWPLGFVADCANAPDTCPHDVESPYARVSTDNLRQNLIGIRRLFEGCGAGYSGLGFDDWLIDVGSESEALASEMIGALAAAQSAVDALDPPLEDAIVSDPSKVAALHAAFKVFTDLLKSQFISVLNLEPPMGTEGDND